jgi:WD40 repeat protein
VTAVAFLPDSKTLISGSEDKGLKVWDAVTGKEKLSAAEQGSSNEVPILAATPDGKKFVAWVATEVVETYDVEGAKLAATLTVKEKEIKSLCFSPDATMCAVGTKDGKVRIWDIAKERAVGKEIDAHKAEIADLALTPDKKTLMTADENGQIKVWDLAKRTATHTIDGHKKRVVGFAVTADGKRFATTAEDNVVKLWETGTGKELRSWDTHVPSQASRPFVRGLAFTPDGKYLATANGDTTVYLLECPAGGSEE